MTTKINPLDYGRITQCNTEYELIEAELLGAYEALKIPGRITTTIEITMVFESEEDMEIVNQAILDNINGGAS